MRRPRVALLALALLALTAIGGWRLWKWWRDSRPWQPDVADAADDGVQAIGQFQVAEGFEVSLWAAEPMLANPVAMSFDQRGRCFVAETHRRHTSMIDIRKHMDHVDADLALDTVADRMALYKRWFSIEAHRAPERFLRDLNKDGQFDYRDFEVEYERVRMIEDRDGDGSADDAVTLADGFNTAVTGLAGDVLAHAGRVYFACIPDVWLLGDNDGDGKADVRKSISHGYGVHMGYGGHDLHGLTIGPDGRLYFSMGDRGLNVTTTGGRTLAYPNTGAVLRCEPDGSNLEVFAYGLRNPQELAFDEYGNLFTGDNNGDHGDLSRFVYVIAGGDSGWRTGYQYLPRGGPWHDERLWHLAGDGQPAYVVPPVGHVGRGPVGLAYDPGTGLPPSYRRHFFLCDFVGSAAYSGVLSFAVEPRGAGFVLHGEPQRFLWSVLATDVEFGPGGGLYVLDWVMGYAKSKRGRIYHVREPASADAPAAKEVTRLLAEGMSNRSSDELVHLLAHADQRVRQAAQFALVDKAATDELASAAKSAGSPLARLHAVWGLGQLGRRGRDGTGVLLNLLNDADPQVRINVARTLGDLSPTPAMAALTRLLADDDPRVGAAAAIAVGRLGIKTGWAPAVALLRKNADHDPYVRHAAVMALTGIAKAAGAPYANTLAALHDDASPAVRLGAVLALRRLKSPELTRYLDDTDPLVVAEAARAIHDVPVESAMGQLASLIDRSLLTDAAIAGRVVNANYRLGGADRAAALARYATKVEAPEAARAAALAALGDWADPSGRDRIIGLWRPIAPRPASDAIAALGPLIDTILRTPPPAPALDPITPPPAAPSLPAAIAPRDAARAQAARAAARLGLTNARDALFDLAHEEQASVAARIEAIKALAALDDPRLANVLQWARTQSNRNLRIEAYRLAAEYEPATPQAVAEMAALIDHGSAPEQQAALAALGAMRIVQADDVLVRWLDRLIAGTAPREIRFDIIDAARQRDSQSVRQKLDAYLAGRKKGDRLARYQDLLFGGDADAGRRVFVEHLAVSCIRCHRVNGVGGQAGPDLTGVGARRDRAYLLESIVLPNRTITQGFEQVVVRLNDGETIIGVVKAETPAELTIDSPRDGVVTIRKSDIASRRTSLSAMPEGLADLLRPRQLRDLIEFLASLK